MQSLKFLACNMDCGDMDTLKAEKMMAMKKFKRNRKTKKFLRYAIVAASAVLLSWSSVWLPVIVQTFELYFRYAFSVVGSTKFVFFICNVIIVTLAVKSGQLSLGGGSNGGSPDLYDEFLKNTENRQKFIVNSELPSDEPEEKQCVLVTEPEVHEKSILPEFNLVETETETKTETKTETEAVIEEKVTSSKRVKIARSKSANIGAPERTAAKGRRKLQRSETSIGNPQRDGGDDMDEESCLAVGEVASDAQFNAFIAKQLKLQRQESLALEDEV